MSDAAAQPMKTKIVATLGPASDPPDVLDDILSNGVSVCRLNFSHGTHEEHGRRLAAVRAWAAANNRPTAILGDLCGPKIRLNTVTDEPIRIGIGDPVRFERGDAPCTAERLTTTYAPLIDEVALGHRIYIDDGIVRLLVVEKERDALVCTVTAGGALRSRKGVNLPDTDLSVPSLTQQDRIDAAWAIEAGVDFLALSFVRRAADLHELRALLGDAAKRIHLVAKVEKVEALDEIEAIIDAADGIMVARGDLGVEMDVWRVPLVQKELIAKCRAVGKPVIVATQMLQSMVAAAMPTRAEVSDVANAIMDGADAVMLSAESAAGKYPKQSVDIMQRVAHATEAYLEEHEEARLAANLLPHTGTTAALARATLQAALQLDARVVAAWTASGETVRLLARHRAPVPIVGLTYSEHVYRRLNLLYGVIPIRVVPAEHPAEMASQLDAELLARGLAERGDAVVVITATDPQTPGATDTIHVHRVGAD